MSHSRLELGYASDVALIGPNEEIEGRQQNRKMSKSKKNKLTFRIIYTSIEDEAEAMPAQRRMPSTYSLGTKKDLSIDKINDSTLLCHMQVTQGMNDCMHYIGGALTCFFHVEDQHLPSIFFFFPKHRRYGTLLTSPLKLFLKIIVL